MNPRDLKIGAESIKQDSGLLKLPGELRNRIYEEALTSTKPITMIDSDDSRSTSKENWMPSLLRTCRQIREEASGIFFGANTFLLTSWNEDPDPSLTFFKTHTIYRVKYDTAVFAKWLKALPEKHRLCIGRIYLDYQDGYVTDEIVQIIINTFHEELVREGVALPLGIVYVKFLERGMPRMIWVDSSLTPSKAEFDWDENSVMS